MPLFSLPMYDWPEVRAATDAWARGLARHLRGHGFPDVPDVLSRLPDYRGTWHASDLLLSQTCGYPLIHEYRQQLIPVATPHYSAEGCRGPYYSSLVLVRSADAIGGVSDLRGRTCAINDRESMSGMLALKLVFAPWAHKGDFFSRTVETGSHENSLLAVQQGRADVCAIDAVCVALARRYRPELLWGLVEIARSPLVPGLPLVTSAACSREQLGRLRGALAEAFADPELQRERDALLLAGLSNLDPDHYSIIAKLEAELKAEGDLNLWQAA
jgi:ABC-type phosphate/phosphonate transport system substrate-binding protein